MNLPIIYCAALLAGWIAGSLAVLTVCYLRGRMDLWSRYWFFYATARVLPVLFVRTLGWYALLVAVASYALVFLILWVDRNKRFPKLM